MIVQGSREGPRLTEMVHFRMRYLRVDLRMRTNMLTVGRGRFGGNAGADRKQAIYYWWPNLYLEANSTLDSYIIIVLYIRTRITGILLPSSWIHNTPVHNLCLCTYPVAQKEGVAPRSRDMSWLD